MLRLFSICWLILASVTFLCKGQEDARYSQYTFNGLVLNPAYAGAKDALSLTATYRLQWVEIDGAPKTLIIGAHAPMGAKKNVGLGLHVENDKVGVSNRLSLNTSYSYKIPLANGFLAGGITAGLVYMSSLYTSLYAPGDEVDEEFLEDETYLKPNFGFGFFFANDMFYAGLSIPSLLAYNKDEEFISRTTKQYRLYTLTAGAIFPVSDDVALKPSFLVKSLPAITPLQLDLSLQVLIRGMFWLGSTVRTMDVLEWGSVSFMAAYSFTNGLVFGYSYDFNLNDIRMGSSGGSHELILNYDIPFNNKNGDYLAPKYF